MTCRTPQFVARGPLIPVCRLNSFWADIIKNHQAVDAKGNVVSRAMAAEPDIMGHTNLYQGNGFVFSPGFTPSQPNTSNNQ
jgi:hypothetical protein